MMFVLPPVWMLLFGFRHSSAVRSQFDSPSAHDVLITEIGQQKEEFPECVEIAKSTYPGGCDPKKSAFACFSMEKVYRPEQTDIDVAVHWACSQGLNQEGMSKEACSLRPWTFDGEVNGQQLSFTAPAGIYAGACQFSLPEPQGESTKAATTPEKPAAVATTPEQSREAATTPEQSPKAATTPEKPTVGATTPEQLTEAATTPEQSTKAATTPEKPTVVATTPEQTTEAATTPMQATKAATTPEKPSVVATTPEQATEAATTPMQATLGPTTAKNGAAGNSGSLLTTVLGLAVYSLH